MSNRPYPNFICANPQTGCEGIDYYRWDISNTNHMMIAHRHEYGINTVAFSAYEYRLNSNEDYDTWVTMDESTDANRWIKYSAAHGHWQCYEPELELEVLLFAEKILRTTHQGGRE